MESHDSESQSTDRHSPKDGHETARESASPQRLMLRRFIGVMLGVYWCVMFLATHVSISSEGRAIPGADKVVHFVGYGVLGLLLSLWVALRRPLTAKVVIVVLATISLYGIIDELLQIPVGRDCDPMDWLADLLGASCGVGLMAWVSRSRQRPSSS